MKGRIRTLALAAALASTALVPAAAQGVRPWTMELGLRSTFTSMDVEGTGLSLVDLPAGGSYLGFGGGSALYAILPVGGDRFALEPSFGYSDQSSTGNITAITAGARLLFTVWRGAYLAGGPVLSLRMEDGEGERRFGGNLAGGYRFPVGGVVSARAELFYETMGAGDLYVTEPTSSIGLALGLGMGLGPRERAAVDSSRMWEFALGVQGGFTHVSIPSQIDLGSFWLPGGGSNPGLFGFPISSISPWFVVIPLSDRIALEPSFSFHSFAVEEGKKGSSYEAGLRANYAFTRAFYAGLSAEILEVSGDDFDGAYGSTGVGGVTGLRFPLVGGVMGRVEANFRTFKSGEDSILGDYTAFGFTFGMMAPLR